MVRGYSEKNFSGDVSQNPIVLSLQKNQEKIMSELNKSFKDMQKYYIFRAKVLKTDRTETAQKQFNEIAYLNLWQTNDINTILNGQDKLRKFIQYTTYGEFDYSFEEQLFACQKLLRKNEEKLELLKKGEKTNNSKPCQIFNTNIDNKTGSIYIENV